EPSPRLANPVPGGRRARALPKGRDEKEGRRRSALRELFVPCVGRKTPMQKTLAFALCAAVGAAASAHPFGEKWSTPIPGPVGVPTEALELDEDFEAYSVGQGVTTMGGWELWPGGMDATVTDVQAASGTKSGNWST